MSNSGEQHQGLATSSISEAGGRMSLSSTESFEKMSPRYISISRASDTPTSDEILSTTPTSIKFPPNAPQAELPCPSDPKVVKNIEVLAAFVAKNGPQFEDMAREKQAKDPNFQFLFGGEEGSEAYIAHNFYEWKKRQLLSQEDMSPLQEHQKLNPESHVRSETLKPDSQRSLRSDASEMHNDEIDQSLPSPQPKLIKAQEKFSCSTLRNDGDTFEQQRLPLDDFSTRRRDARRRTGFDRQSMKDVDTLPDLLRPVKDSVPSAVNKEERSLVCDDPHIGTSAKYSEALEQRKPAEMISHLEEKQSCHRYNDDKEANLQTPQVQTFGHFDANSFQKRNDPTRDAERSTRTMHIGRPNIRNPVKSSQSGPHTIDEFGRLVRQGVNDSDSDEDHHSFRKRQRSPSGSRSRSPGGSRRMWQSPSWSPRRRGNYHGSYSRSPKQHRSHSPTPPWDVKRGSDWRGDQGSFGRGRRGGRRGDPVQPCYDFSRGRCFRGSSCRFIHQDAHMTFSEGRDRVSGGNKDYRRRDNFMDHEGTYTSKDVVWSSASRVAPRIQRAANVTGGEGWGWPNKAMEGSENKNDGFKVDEGFSTQDHENTTISGPISAAFTAEAISNSTKPSFPAPLSDDSQMALSSCSWGTNTNRQSSPVQASQLSTFANEQISPLSSNSRVSFHPPQTLPFLPPPPFPPPSPNLPPPPPPLLAPRIPPPPPPPPALTPIAIFSTPTCAPGVPASLPGADQLFDHSPICFGRPLSSNMPVSLNSVSQQPVAAGAPPASFPAVSVVVPLHQHATHVTLLSAQTGAEMPGSHDAVLISLSEEPRLPSPTPASQLPFNNVFPQRQGFTPISSSLPQYAPGVSKQQETAAPNYTTSFGGMVSHQQKDGGHLSFSKNSTLASNPSQEVPPHQFTNSSHSGTTEIMNSHSKALLEPPSTNQHLSTADMINLSAGPCTQSFTSASGAVAVTHNPRDSSDTAMDVLPQITSKGVPSSSLTHTNYIAKSIDEPADGDVRSQSSGASFEQVMPSLTRSSLGMGLKLSEVDTEPVCPEEPMSPGPAVSGMHTLNPEPPSDLVMENVSPGLPARMTQHDPNTSQQLTLVIGNSTAEKDSSTLEIQNNSPDNVQALPVEHGLERASLNLEDAQERLKKDKEGKPVMLLRVAVTEYVKEVLKPTWKEGHMSKEAFKTIAKKAVDKVLGTLQSHQVPKTQDKVDHFMSFSRPKIANLVQGYVEKYVKIT